MIRAYKFLLRPTVRQAQALVEMLRDHCSLYNGALQERRNAWRHPSKTTVRYGMQSAQLKEIRAFDPERHGRWSFSSQQATLRRLDKAFAAFFRRVTSGEAPGYPRFRGVNWFDTVDFPRDGDGCRWDSTPHDPVTRVRFQGVGHVRVNQHRPVVGKVKTVSVKREGRKWFVVLSAEQDQPEPLPATGSVVGIDLGVANFLADSNGDFVSSPRHGRRAAAKLQAAQQALSRFPRCKAKARTANHQRAVEKVAQLHGKVPPAPRPRTQDGARPGPRARRHCARGPQDPQYEQGSRVKTRSRPAGHLPAQRGRGEGRAQHVDPRCRLGGVPDDPARQG